MRGAATTGGTASAAAAGVVAAVVGGEVMQGWTGSAKRAASVRAVSAEVVSRFGEENATKQGLM